MNLSMAHCRTWLVLLIAAACPAIFSATPCRAQTPPAAGAPPAGPPPDLVSQTGTALSQSLNRFWPESPEWMDMFAEILQGSRLGPRDGWFRKATRQTRYDWEAAAQRYDADRDGKIERSEFPGTDGDFARLDRDRDAALTAGDFDWSDHALASSPGSMFFSRVDRDSNGKLTHEELQQFFEALDPDEAGFLSLDDLKGFLPAPRPSPGGGGGDDGPTRTTLVRGLFRQEIGSLQPGPALGASVPDFTLRTLDGGDEITLSQRIGPRPVVLVFGNFTCGPFRRQGGNVEKVYQRYKDRADFLMVYVREAHPTDGWYMPGAERYGADIAQPRTYDERVGVAQTCQKSLKFGMPFLVDTIDDQVGAAYSGMPSRLYVLDRQGKVAYKSGRGPFGFKPAEMEQALVLLLTELEHPQNSPTPEEPDQAAPADAGANARSCRVPLLDDAAAWARLPPGELPRDRKLPHWARALAASLPRTTAVMLEMDYLYRTSEELDPKLRARMRWIAARANRSAYGMRYAEADLVRAGEPPRDERQMLDSLAALPAAERAALAFARKMTLAAATVTDSEVDLLIEDYGERQVTAMVLQMAYANFQDRLLTSLGVTVEPDGPLAPLELHVTPILAAVEPAFRPPLPENVSADAPARIDDREWTSLSFGELQQLMEAQRARPARIAVPAWDSFKDQLDPALYSPDRPTRILWSLVVMGYQPRLATAWLTGLRTFGREARQDRVLEETLFWVITRSIQCFY